MARRENDSTVEDGVYKLVIVGGGPAGIGVFIRAARIGLFPRLVNPAGYGPAEDQALAKSLSRKQLGVAVVHDGDKSTFGSGKLGSYMINSNTFARSLLGSILDERADLDPPETIRGTFLERMESYESKKNLESIGMAPASLKDIGSFLTGVGIELLEEMKELKYEESSRCLFHSRGISFQQLQNANGCPYVRLCIRNLSDNSDSFILAENIVLAMGGKQMIPSLGSLALDKKVYLSDNCLREDGAVALKNYLSQFKDPSVCIVGGSHSAFSAAWMLLNPGACKSSKAPKIPTEQSNFKQVLNFGPKSITILHRSNITCFYMTRKEAELDGIHGATVDRAGCVNTFTGLREDAKRLYKAMHTKKENRARLFQVNERGCQLLNTKAYESANAIIWCCGYATNMIPAHDSNGQNIQFHEEHGMVKLSSCGNLLQKKSATVNHIIPNFFGIGIGFCLRAGVDEMGKEARADGVTVYHRRGASLVLAGIFGECVYGSGCKTFEEMVEKNEKKKALPNRSKMIGAESVSQEVRRSITSVAVPLTKAAVPTLGCLRLDQKPILVNENMKKRTSNVGLKEVAISRIPRKSVLSCRINQV